MRKTPNLGPKWKSDRGTFVEHFHAEIEHGTRVQMHLKSVNILSALQVEINLSFFKPFLFWLRSNRVLLLFCTVFLVRMDTLPFCFLVHRCMKTIHSVLKWESGIYTICFKPTQLKGNSVGFFCWQCHSVLIVSWLTEEQALVETIMKSVFIAFASFSGIVFARNMVKTLTGQTSLNHLYKFVSLNKNNLLGHWVCDHFFCTVIQLLCQ